MLQAASDSEKLFLAEENICLIELVFYCLEPEPI